MRSGSREWLKAMATFMYLLRPDLLLSSELEGKIVQIIIISRCSFFTFKSLVRGGTRYKTFLDQVFMSHQKMMSYA